MNRPELDAFLSLSRAREALRIAVAVNEYATGHALNNPTRDALATCDRTAADISNAKIVAREAMAKWASIAGIESAGDSGVAA